MLLLVSQNDRPKEGLINGWNGGSNDGLNNGSLYEAFLMLMGCTSHKEIMEAFLEDEPIAPLMFKALYVKKREVGSTGHGIYVLCVERSIHLEQRICPSF
eukprot:10223812-Ditylum_brightwellii.AAC.1